MEKRASKEEKKSANKKSVTLFFSLAPSGRLIGGCIGDICASSPK